MTMDIKKANELIDEIIAETNDSFFAQIERNRKDEIVIHVEGCVKPKDFLRIYEISSKINA